MMLRALLDIPATTVIATDHVGESAPSGGLPVLAIVAAVLVIAAVVALIAITRRRNRS